MKPYETAFWDMGKGLVGYYTNYIVALVWSKKKLQNIEQLTEDPIDLTKDSIEVINLTEYKREKSRERLIANVYRYFGVKRVDT